MALGVMPGLAAALALAPLGVLGVVAQGATRRAQKQARDRTALAPEPLEGPSRAWRGWVKGLLAGPLGMTAAMGIAFCYAVWAPGAVQTRLLIAALLVPALWGLAMTDAGGPAVAAFDHCADRHVDPRLRAGLSEGDRVMSRTDKTPARPLAPGHRACSAGRPFGAGHCLPRSSIWCA
jgi:hypothetical protein